MRGTVLLYLKCFLPHSLPQEGAQPHPPGVAPCSPSFPSPRPALLGQPEFPAAACHPFTLTSFGSSSAPTSKACPTPLPLPLLSYLFCTCGLGL